MTNIPEWISHDVDRLRSTIALALRAAANETTLTSDTSRLTTVESILRADQPHDPEAVAHARRLNRDVGSEASTGHPIPSPWEVGPVTQVYSDAWDLP